MATLVHSGNHNGYQKELASDPEASKLIRAISESFEKEEKERVSRREFVRQLAKRMEEIKLKYELAQEVNMICSEICKMFRKAGYDDDDLRFVWRAFDKEGYEKYKREKVFSMSLPIVGNLPEENSLRFNELKHSIKVLLTADPMNLTREQIQDMRQSAEKILDRYDSICIEHKIATVNTSSTSHEFYNMQRANDKYPEKIQTQEPTYQWTELSSSWRHLGDLCYEIAEQCAHFPPQIMSQASKLAKGVNVFCQFIEVGRDKKHKRHWMDWLANLESSVDATINGTATMHPTESNLCYKCTQADLKQDPMGTMGLRKPVEMISMEVQPNVDVNQFMAEHHLINGLDTDDNGNSYPAPNDKDKEKMQKILKDGFAWVCEKCNGVYGMEIIVSREHTSDMLQPTIDLMRNMVNHFPPFISFCNWYSSWRRPILDAQTINLSPKLKARKSG